MTSRAKAAPSEGRAEKCSARLEKARGGASN